MARILIVDDDHALRGGLVETVEALGHAAMQAADGRAGLAIVAEGGIDAMLLDLRMPGIDGLEVLRRLRDMPGRPPVAVLTAVPTAANTIEAMRLGAVDHLAKPIGRADLAALLTRLLPGGTAREAGPTTPAEAIVGGSAAMRQVQKTIGLVADTDATVLITGETGTGKEVVARAIHGHGRRADRPFVPVNCAAIPGELLESQLFGHVRGAFTGAVADRAGNFREAHRGTIFLDEIGDMDANLQAKLLRVIQERVVMPLGGKPVAVDVRILAATHRDLAREVAAGRFREDLFYRLGVVPLPLPPLRERLADIVPLAEHFLALSADDLGPRLLSAEAASRLLAHPWPGNVRELRNAMERVAVLARHKVLTAADFSFLGRVATGSGAATEASVATGSDLPGAVARLETAMIRAALAESGGQRAEAARRLGIHRQLLYEKMRRYGLEASGSRTERVGESDDGKPS